MGKNIEVANQDQQFGVDIVRKAIKLPTMTIADNAGIDGQYVVETILANPAHGYDARTGVFCDMIEAGIVDPTKVVKQSLNDASSVASLLTTAECAIVDKPEKAAAAPAGGMGGMG